MRLPPPLAKETRLTIWLIVSLLFFDCYPQFSIEKSIKYCGKLSEKKQNYNQIKNIIEKGTLFLQIIALTSEVQLMKRPPPLDFGAAYKAINLMERWE